jgi:serine protease
LRAKRHKNQKHFLEYYISVDAGQKVAIAKVKLDITHDYTADLSVDLISPTGKTIRLFNRKGGINLKTEFMVPVDATPKGDWKLQVIDSIKTDEGTLNSWEISFESYKCES